MVAIMATITFDSKHEGLFVVDRTYRNEILFIPEKVYTVNTVKLLLVLSIS